MSPNDADGMANSVDPDQTAPLEAVWSGSALFAQTYLSENLGSLRYFLISLWKKMLPKTELRKGYNVSSFLLKQWSWDVEGLLRFIHVVTQNDPCSYYKW